MTPDDLGVLFNRFEHSAFRLEAKDRYDVTEEADRLAAFRAGDPLPTRTVENDSWLALVAAATQMGREISRVRIVGRPLTEYTRFELAVYPENIAAGETVRIRERRTLTPDDDSWAHQDFWLFDDQIAVRLLYDDVGHFLGVEQALDTASYSSAKQTAIAGSIDFFDFSVELTSLER
jgi:hypothetical protein